LLFIEHFILLRYVFITTSPLIYPCHLPFLYFTGQKYSLYSRLPAGFPLQGAT